MVGLFLFHCSGIATRGMGLDVRSRRPMRRLDRPLPLGKLSCPWESARGGEKHPSNWFDTNGNHASHEIAQPLLTGLFKIAFRNQVKLQATCGMFWPLRRRRTEKPIAPNPTSIIAQVPGSGTAATEVSIRTCLSSVI